MAKQVVNEFTSWELSDQEIAVAVVLSPEQTMYYQTMLSGYAAQKLALVYNSKDPIVSAQKEAELQGQIGILTQLLRDSEQAQNGSQETDNSSN